MHQPPIKQDRQSWESVAKDLDATAKRHQDAAEWVRNLGSVIRGAEGILYANRTPLFPGARSVDIVFDLTVNEKRQDVGVFSIVRRWSMEELQAALIDPMTSAPAARQIHAQIWESNYKMKTFETWMVDDKDLWKGDPVATTAWMNAQVSAWLSYWFWKRFTVRHRRDRLFIPALGSA